MTLICDNFSAIGRITKNLGAKSMYPTRSVQNKKQKFEKVNSREEKRRFFLNRGGLGCFENVLSLGAFDIFVLSYFHVE